MNRFYKIVTTIILIISLLPTNVYSKEYIIELDTFQIIENAIADNTNKDKILRLIEKARGAHRKSEKAPLFKLNFI